MLNPVAVTSDGVRLYVTDLGYNRVLVWNSIPDGQRRPGRLRDRPAGPEQLAAEQRITRSTPPTRQAQADPGVVHGLERHGHERQSDLSRTPATRR